ncbi:paraneoplastic antigen Ma1 homolog [Chanodichthys erythropterus]|uniref:paraneoplastic antigen Ma1 homolog n=1 Tax=Chanodichthys erythropterus TaxID=933992 RepID=UPI00351F6E77
MAFHSNPFIQEELSHWCEEAIVNEKHALLLLGVPANTDVSQIEEAVQRVKALGRVCVRDTKVGPSPSSLIVLCECCEVIDPTHMPIELQIGDEEETWKIVVSKKCETTSIGFADKFSSLLNGEGKTIKDVQELLSPLSSSAGSPESIIRAVGELLEKTVLPSSDTSAYRRLQIFSATIPIPSGDETMENWIEQARLMITECECSEKEKRRRIVESLKGPALEIIKAVRFSSPDASALQYIEALESTFGTSESGEDLYFAFRLLRQNQGIAE